MQEARATMTAVAAVVIAFFTSGISRGNAAPAGGPASEPAQPRRIKLTILDGETATGTLADNEAARDFAALLPLDLDLNDSNGTEKISDLPKRLSRSHAPSGHDPSRGDMGYYAPWGNLAVYYRDFHYSEGLVLLGRLDHVPEAFLGGKPIHVTFTAE